MKNKQLISVGIPTFNSSKYLESCIKSVISKKTVGEVLISDDCSNESEFKNIKEIVKQFGQQKNIRLIRNEKNIGAYENKLKLIENSFHDFIYILDSDNLSGQNLDTIVENLFKNNDLNESYLIQPNIMYQFWKYPKFAKLFCKLNKKYIVKFYESDKVLKSKDIKTSLLLNSGNYDLKNFSKELEVNVQKINYKDTLQSKWIFWVLNCGNFIVNKNAMKDIAKKGLKIDREIRSVDAIAFSYLWLSSGKEIKIINEFFHHHRKREDSVSFTERDNSKKGIEFFIEKVLINF